MKLLVYRTIILAIVFYSSETWRVKEVCKQRLLVCEIVILIKICSISLKDKKCNTDIRKDVRRQNLVQVLQQCHLSPFGHVSCMGLERYPYVALHRRMHGQRPISRPKKKWINNICEDCIEQGISILDAIHQAMDRRHWRNIIHNMGCQHVSALSPRH